MNFGVRFPFPYLFISLLFNILYLNLHFILFLKIDQLKPIVFLKVFEEAFCNNSTPPLPSCV